jgi:tetraacyldisaccharide 4'-kinase
VIQSSAFARLSGLLERDGPRSSWRRAASRLWARAANPVRPVALPSRCRVVGVGGPTLGGSYKTPLVLALARALSERGEAVAVAAHGYRARARAARRVSITDDVREVGDDALLLARALEDADVPVVVGGSREASIELAASLGECVVVDGLLQASPARLDGSLLVVDAHKPWGSGKCPPAGDLRASRRTLLAAADSVVLVADPARGREVARDGGERRAVSNIRYPVFRVMSDVAAALGPQSETIRLSDLAHRRFGLLAAIARPERVVEALRARGLHPAEVRLFGDHRSLPERTRRASADSGLDFWLTTAKCATKLGPVYEGAPVFVLEHRLVVPDELVERAIECRRRRTPDNP